MSGRPLDLAISVVEDPPARDNFDRITDFFNEDLFTKFDGKHYTLSIESAVTNFKFPHKLRFIPKDTFLTSKSNSSTVTFNYEEFDNTFIDITTSGAVDIRFVAGRFVFGRP